MLISLAVIILLSTGSCLDGRVLLYNTENDNSAEKFDCVYYVYDDGEEIPYCRRSVEPQLLDRFKNKCKNQAEKIFFRDLMDKKIDPSVIFKWNSNVELIDLYASIFHNRSSINDNNDQFICNCTKPNTFGKYCEYQLTHQMTSFSRSIQAQFEQKKNDSWNTQRYGKFLCYRTLLCSDNHCLDWHEICDGVQRCIDGIDEENCDKLEFNECEDEEFRCTNGMCIPEEFWLDGDYDCMDWSDEFLLDNGNSCPCDSSSLRCDEHLCLSGYYSCGDGQCIHWQNRMAFRWLERTLEHCFNKRNLNYMCEVSRDQIAWTLDNGLCWPERGYDDPRYPPWHLIHTVNITVGKKCYYLFLCALSRGFERDCPCNHQNCSQMMVKLCPDPHFIIVYPPLGLINPNYFIYYNYSQSLENPLPSRFLLGSSIKCRGYLFKSGGTLNLNLNDAAFSIPLISRALCTNISELPGFLNSSPPYDENKFCWNNSLTFTGRPYAVNPNVCTSSGECISQYRIHDGQFDCLDNQDELINLDKNYCTGNVGRQRFQCFNDEHKCLSTYSLGGTNGVCSNRYDQSWYGTGTDLRSQFLCTKTQMTNCYRVKAYIQLSSFPNLTRDDMLSTIEQQKQTDRMPFRDNCNSFWNTETHEDELSSYCQHWICLPNQYRCRTNQCIELDWVCDGEWDCSDASDEEAIWINQPWSSHNARLEDLDHYVNKCKEHYSNAPFSLICNLSSEFGCYRSDSSNPLIIDNQTNRPCIHLNRIGDGVEDCHNAYDEKNTFVSNLYREGMWGWSFRCGDEHLTYGDACQQPRNCSYILCSSYRAKTQSCSDLTDFVCLGETLCRKNIRCNKKPNCPHGEDEYWCPVGDPKNKLLYRFSKLQASQPSNSSMSFPTVYPPIGTMNFNEQQVSKPMVNSSNIHLFEMHSYQCNRGVAAIEGNVTRCLCSPAYYGDWCEFFSDRISFIVHIDQNTKPISIRNSTLKISSHLLFNDRVIDYHEFHSVSAVEKMERIKHRFYLRYLHSEEMLIKKKDRYFNRTDILNNHPYSVHFHVFVLENNHSIEEIGAWYFPIYFDYLPAFRLAVILKFPSWLENVTLSPCSKTNCNENSTCLAVFNGNNSYSCSCKSGYHGKNCSKYEPRCENYCSVNGLCRPDHLNFQTKNITLHCICPLSYFGPRCYLKYDECNSNSCLNNGTCLPRYDPSGEHPFLCLCSDRFYGLYCEKDKAFVHVNLNMTTTVSVRATVVQFYNLFLSGRALVTSIENQQIIRGFPKFIELYDSAAETPLMAILKVYEDLTIHPHYFLVYFLTQSKINMTSSPASCLHASSLLSTEKSDSVPLVFKYHRICAKNKGQVCFYDEVYFCSCQEYRAECFIHDTEHEHCQKCLSGGKCLQGDLKNSQDYVCLCPFCHQGHQCEFSMQAFGFTLDSLLIHYSTKVKFILTSIVSLVFIFGVFNNFCSFITFKRSAPRKFGVGNYLLILSCVNQIALACFLIKFIQITFGISNIAMCKVVSYSLSVMTRLTYWLTSWITVDRLIMIVFPTSRYLKNAYIAIKISLVTSVVLFGMHVHEVIYSTVILYHLTDSSICVINFETKFISVYHRISTLIHYLCPFVIQVICITLLILLAARSRAKTSGQNMNFRQVLKKQFQTQKELYVTPMIIILSSLPQIIFTFSLACSQLNAWQRHALLISYLFSYNPQLLGFILYVLPSSSYKTEFHKTSLGKKTLTSAVHKKTNQPNIESRKKKTLN